MPSLFHTACPSCGANIEVQSATAVTVVCAYCQSMLVRDGDGLAASGRHSALLQDFTPLQLGTSGSYQGMLFTLIGRLQVQYEGGSWNEWHALLQDGSSAWLSEASDGFVFTRPETSPQTGRLPTFDEIRVGRSFFTYASAQYAVADVREASRSRYAAEGELPYQVPENEVAKVVDCRSGKSFLTLDYTTDAQKPEVFVGEGVALAVLGLQNLRSQEQIQSSAGKLKGSPQNSKCPNCGGTVQWVAGMASHVVCQYCQSQLDFSDNDVRLLEVKNMREQQGQAWRLPLGSKARILGQEYWLIGAMKQSEISGSSAFSVVDTNITGRKLVPEGEPWIEYLLYSTSKGFLWLTEMSENRWAIAKTLDHWPLLSQPLQPLDTAKRTIAKLYDYGGQVQFAAGAFYWQVAPDDVTYYVDFGREKQKLSTSVTHFEQSWSVITEVPAGAVAAWFGNEKIAKAMPMSEADKLAKHALDASVKNFDRAAQKKDGSSLPMVFLLIYGVLNFPALLIGLMGNGLTGVIVVSCILYWLLSLPLKNKE